MRYSWVAIATAALLAACSSGPEPTGDRPPLDADATKPAAAPAPAPAPAAAKAGPDQAELANRIKRYFTASGQVPDDVTLEVTEVVDSEIDGLDKGTLKVSRGDQSQDVGFYVSADGRWFLRADPVDLSVDPVAQVIDAIKIGPNDPYLGKEDAAVTIVEYSDFQCPFCARAEEIIQTEVLKEYGDRVKFVYKQFPLVSIHPWAEPASTIGLCVLQQNGNPAYWKYHGAVFAKQKDINAEKASDQLLDMAKDAGADRAKVEACVAEGKTAEIVAATLAEAEAIGVNSTPTFFVNGRRLSGAQPLEAFKAIIDPELAKGAQG